MTGRFLEVIRRVDGLGRCGWEIRRGLLYRFWKEGWCGLHYWLGEELRLE